MATKTTMTAAEARALADRLDAEERDRVNAEREARRKARLAKAHELLTAVVDGPLARAYPALAQVRTDDPHDIAAALRLRSEYYAALHAHHEASNYLVREIWQLSGQPMRPNIGSAPAEDHVRPILQPEDHAGCDPVIDHLIGYAARHAASRQLLELGQALAAAEANPGSVTDATMPAVTFRSDKALIFGDATFTARLGDDGRFDLSAFYYTTNAPAQIERLRSTPGVTEITDTTN
jgi:hypothetical protein